MDTAADGDWLFTFEDASTSSDGGCTYQSGVDFTVDVSKGDTTWYAVLDGTGNTETVSYTSGDEEDVWLRFTPHSQRCPITAGSTWNITATPV